MEKIPVFLPNLGSDELESVKTVFDIGWLGMGSTTKEFEDLISEFLELEDRFVLSTNTATSALHLSLRCCDIGPGDEVTAHTILDSVRLDDVAKATEFYALLSALLK
ncbi:MAG: DegT/DnrJ/EryC1/StrS family aminotransferase [Chloroflexi bacterium]|nr:DegT/DnrJ/EryC1/StrS family aminotransferase [Chloroflexota bacterium]